MPLDYLIKPTKANDRSFVLAKVSKSIEARKREIKERILNSAYVISDLDYTLIDSPTLSLVVRRFFEGGFLDIRQDVWAVKAFFQYLLHREKAFYPMWLEYRNKFKYEFRHYVKLHEPALSFYPGVQEFFSLLPKTIKKIMATRTLPEIAAPFADHLGFSIMHYSEKDKISVLKETGCSNPDILIGDSKEDEDIISELKKKENCSLTICVTSSLHKINELFDINIGRDYRGLNSILNSD